MWLGESFHKKDLTKLFDVAINSLERWQPHRGRFSGSIPTGVYPRITLSRGRVLRPKGMLVISSPNKSVSRFARVPGHVHEFDAGCRVLPQRGAIISYLPRYNSLAWLDRSNSRMGYVLYAWLVLVNRYRTDLFAYSLVGLVVLGAGYNIVGRSFSPGSLADIALRIMEVRREWYEFTLCMGPLGTYEGEWTSKENKAWPSRECVAWWRSNLRSASWLIWTVRPCPGPIAALSSWPQCSQTSGSPTVA